MEDDVAGSKRKWGGNEEIGYLLYEGKLVAYLHCENYVKERGIEGRITIMLLMVDVRVWELAICKWVGNFLQIDI